MATNKLIVGVLALFSLVCAHPASAPVVPGAFIVEYADGVDIDSHLSSLQHMASTRLKLDHKLFKGASLRFHDVDNAHHHAKLLATTPHVKKIWPIHLHEIPEHTVHWSAGVDATLEELQDAPATRQTLADTFSPHVMTQVNRLRDEGYLGEGIKIAIIDSGVSPAPKYVRQKLSIYQWLTWLQIDYKHPALGGCFGPGCLVSFGYDLAEDHDLGLDDPSPGPHPLDCMSHGTHVAGIIAAQPGNVMGIIGAASGVNLGSYRVIGCEGSQTAPSDIVIAAFNRAFEDGADIITASLGIKSGWSENPLSVVVSRIVEAGVPCTLPAGNGGQFGLFDAKAGGNALGATAVASVDNSVAPEIRLNASYKVQNRPEQSFGYVPGEPAAWANVTLPLTAVSLDPNGLDQPRNNCPSLPATLPEPPSNLSGYIVLARVDDCSSPQGLKELLVKGARRVILYGDVVTEDGTLIKGHDIPGLEAVALVTADQGEEWLASLSAGHNVTVAMTDPETASPFYISVPNNISGGLPSLFTSWGPTYELDFKPQVAAPGHLILSTISTKDGSYAVISGTSMATPFVAAIYALLMTVRRNKDPEILGNLLSSTSKPLLFNDGNKIHSHLAPAMQQGSGLVQAYDAAYTTSLINVSSLSFNDTDNIVPLQTFTITNNGSRPVVYDLGHEASPTVYTLPSNSSIIPRGFPDVLSGHFAVIDFPDGGSFTLPAGHNKIVKVRAAPPTGLDPRRLPVYSGYIAINGSDGFNLSVPYVGVAGSLHSATVLDTAKTGFDGSWGRRHATNRTYFVPPPGPYKPHREYSHHTADAPVLGIELAFGSPLVRVDVIPVSVSFGANDTLIESLGLKTLGEMPGTPLVGVIPTLS